MNKIEPGLGINRRYLHDEVADRIRALDGFEDDFAPYPPNASARDGLSIYG